MQPIGQPVIGAQSLDKLRDGMVAGPIAFLALDPLDMELADQRAEGAGLGHYLKRTPTRPADRQATSQVLFSSSGLISSEKLSGTGACTSRHAPVLDRLRMMQSTSHADPNEIE